MRNALGPLRPAITEAPGWYFADGELAMPVGDLLCWDISMMNRVAAHAGVVRRDGNRSAAAQRPDGSYGLGVAVGAANGHRVLSHGGEVGGFVASNACHPRRQDRHRRVHQSGSEPRGRRHRPRLVAAADPAGRAPLRARTSPRAPSSSRAPPSPACSTVRSTRRTSPTTRSSTSTARRSATTHRASGSSVRSRASTRPPTTTAAA